MTMRFPGSFPELRAQTPSTPPPDLYLQVWENGNYGPAILVIQRTAYHQYAGYSYPAFHQALAERLAQVYNRSVRLVTANNQVVAVGGP